MHYTQWKTASSVAIAYFIIFFPNSFCTTSTRPRSLAERMLDPLFFDAHLCHCGVCSVLFCQRVGHGPTHVSSFPPSSERAWLSTDTVYDHAFTACWCLSFFPLIAVYLHSSDEHTHTHAHTHTSTCLYAEVYILHRKKTDSWFNWRLRSHPLVLKRTDKQQRLYHWVD